MKTFTSPLIMIGSAAMLSSIALNTNAQELLVETTATAQPLCTDRPDSPAATDFVDAQFGSVAYNGDAFVRTTSPRCDGRFNVRVVDGHGNVRMIGTFADNSITVPHGLFTYYHDNGNMESQGLYRNGTKSGTWERYSSDGRRLADREYPGLDVDRLLELNGLVAYARTLN